MVGSVDSLTASLLLIVSDFHRNQAMKEPSYTQLVDFFVSLPIHVNLVKIFLHLHHQII